MLRGYVQAGNDGQTPLCAAVREVQVGAVRVPSEAGAGVNKQIMIHGSMQAPF